MGLGKRRYPILSGDRSIIERRCQLAVRTTTCKYSEERRLAVVTDTADRRPFRGFRLLPAIRVPAGWRLIAHLSPGMTDQLTSLKTALSDRYTIHRQLGIGG